MTNNEAPLPTTVRVGPLNLNVLCVQNPADFMPNSSENQESMVTFGCLVHKDQTIYLAAGQKKDITADTLLHEVLHAIWATVGGWAYPEADEERIVSMLTGTLLDTLRRNKDLAWYLLSDD
jgi:hypothetical protein